MIRRSKVIRNKVVADWMRGFFGYTRTSELSGPDEVARRYAQALWGKVGSDAFPMDRENLSRSRFNIALAVNDDKSLGFDQLTKRAALVADTLLLSHDWTCQYHSIDTLSWSAEQDEKARRKTVRKVIGLFEPIPDPITSSFPDYPAINASLSREMQHSSTWAEEYGMHCSSTAALGQWILDARPLLTAGLALYLPSFTMVKRKVVDGTLVERLEKPNRLKSVDFLIRDGRAVDASGEEPIKGQLIRPVLQLDLPFVEGVNLREFGEITIAEFNAYSSFQDFLRRSFLDMDESMNAVQSDREISKLGLEIKDQVRSMRSEMMKARKKRALAATGVAIGSASAMLVAVYGPALAAAVTAVGAGTGIWNLINSAIDHSPRTIREDKWYYVWVLENSRSS